MSAMNLTDGGEKKRSASPIPEYRDIRKKTKHTHELIPLDMASPSEQTYGAALSPVTSSSYVSTPPTLSPPESAQTEPNFDSFYIPSDNTSELRLHDPVAIVDCGFCSNGNPCVCRAFAAQSSSSQAKISVEEPMSPLDALPPFQPAVPLPRRRRNPAQAQPLFPLMSLSANPPTSSEAPVCSGDPSNCAACADDPLGQAFCEALGNSSKCDGCPSRGEGSGCSREDSSNSTQPRNVSQSLSLETGGTDTNEQEAIPCSSAWAQLKSHPNIQFADLSLLADVVARRSKCAGPSVVISPAPGTVTPERSISPRPRLVPQEILVQCGRQRVLQVQAEGVREALAVLDRSAPL
jgi:AP-1-like factor